MVGIMLPAEPRVCGKEPCSRLWLFIVPRFLPKRICGHSWQRKQFGVPLCVSRHFPSYLCFSDMVLGHDMHPDPLFGCPLGQLAFWPGCTVTPSFSPVLLACPPGPPFTCPQVLMPVVCTLHVTPGKRVVRKGHTAPCSCQMPLQHCRADGLGLTEAVTHSWQVTWGWAVGWPRAQACHKFCGDLFPLEQRGLALSSWGERA